jgi:hypothetical protein
MATEKNSRQFLHFPGNSLYGIVPRGNAVRRPRVSSLICGDGSSLFSIVTHFAVARRCGGVPLPASPDPNCSKTSKLAASMGVFLDSTARLNGRARNQILTGTDGVFFWDDPNWGSCWAFRGKLRRKLRTGLLEPQIVDLANFIDSEGMRTEVLRRLFSVCLIRNSSDRCFQQKLLSLIIVKGVVANSAGG